MLNLVALMGRLTADPELRYAPNNVPVTTFTLACDRSYVKAGQDRQTDFVNIVAWRQSAEFVTKYFRKGMLVAVQGSLQVRSYVDKDNNKRTAVEVVADAVHFAEPKRADSPMAGAAPARFEPQDAPTHASQPEAFASGELSDFEDVSDDDGDLPF